MTLMCNSSSVGAQRIESCLIILFHILDAALTFNLSCVSCVSVQGVRFQEDFRPSFRCLKIIVCNPCVPLKLVSRRSGIINVTNLFLLAYGSECMDGFHLECKCSSTHVLILFALEITLKLESLFSRSSAP